MKLIPTYNDAIALTLLPNSPFYEIKTVVDEYVISLFNYRMASSSDFKIPGASEIRGISYVFDKDGSYKVFPLLEKFFNLNQVEDTLYSAVKDLKVKSVYNKEDGSVASFIRLPNGKVLGKSKMSFDTEQAIGITRVYNTNSSVKRLVDWTLDNNMTAIFEYVAPTNRIVLRYIKEDLILLRLRDNSTGELLDLANFKDIIGGVSVAPLENYTLDELISMAKYVEDKEGWIVEFYNDLMLKVKTSFYFKMHGLYTEDLHKENIIIGYILSDEIDDVMSKIPQDDITMRNKINNIIEVVKSSINNESVEIEKLYDVFLSINNRKEFSLLYNRNKNFGQVMSMLSGKTSFDLSKEYIRKKTNRLLSAREWLFNQ